MATERQVGCKFESGPRHVSWMYYIVREVISALNECQ